MNTFLKMDKSSLLFLLFCAVFIHCNRPKQEEMESKPESTHLHLENMHAGVVIDQYGGAYINFYLKNDSINPFTWSLKSEQMPENNKGGAPFQGHFLCLGRWGAPTPGEMEMGVPHNGEATNSMWTVEDISSKRLVMAYESTIDDMDIVREVGLIGNEALFKVTERVRNTNTVGRLNNIVQHVTIGPPFLSQSTLVYTNAGPGFFQDHSYPNPHRWEYEWPNAKDSLGNEYNLQHSDIDHNYVSTHLIEDSVGWIAAWNPERMLLLGYVWQKKDYPWVNVWNHMNDGKPVAKGLEFGTTGIGRPYQDLLAVDTRFHGYNSFEFLDAGEEVEKSFYGFLIKIERDIQGIISISINEKTLILELSYDKANVKKDPQLN